MNEATGDDASYPGASDLVVVEIADELVIFTGARGLHASTGRRHRRRPEIRRQISRS